MIPDQLRLRSNRGSVQVQPYVLLCDIHVSVPLQQQLGDDAGETVEEHGNEGDEGGVEGEVKLRGARILPLDQSHGSAENDDSSPVGGRQSTIKKREKSHFRLITIIDRNPVMATLNTEKDYAMSQGEKRNLDDQLVL